MASLQDHLVTVHWLYISNTSITHVQYIYISLARTFIYIQWQLEEPRHQHISLTVSSASFNIQQIAVQIRNNTLNVSFNHFTFPKEASTTVHSKSLLEKGAVKPFTFLKIPLFVDTLNVSTSSNEERIPVFVKPFIYQQQQCAKISTTVLFQTSLAWVDTCHFISLLQVTVRSISNIAISLEP